MSMPVIECSASPVCMGQAVANLVQSVALEQTALSHILNAQGEAMQAAVAMSELDICKLLEVDDAAAALVHSVAELERVLKDKLELAANSLYYPAQSTDTSC